MHTNAMGGSRCRSTRDSRTSAVGALFLAMVSMQLFTQVSASDGSQLVLAYAVNRHGTRNLLPKLSSSLQDAPVIKTTLFRQPPGDANEPSNTCLSPAGSPGAISEDGALYGVINKPNVTWNNFNVIARSSALDRSLASLRSFTTGIFQYKNKPTPATYLPAGEQIVPLYATAGQDKDDVLIRAYNNCPNFDSKLKTWYLSDQFLKMSLATQTFRTYVSRLTDISSAARTDLSYGVTDPFSLDNWYNVWDQFNTWNTTAGAFGNPMPNAGNMEMFLDGSIIPETGGLDRVPSHTSRGQTLLGQITWLAFWLETNKMNSDLAGSLLGGPILADLRTKIADAVDSNAGVSGGTVSFSPYDSTATYPRLLVMSGHYNVQLGVLSALKYDKMTSLTKDAASAALWISVPSLNVTGSIPSAAAVMVFELHRSSSGEYAVRMVIQNGPGTASNPRKYIVLPLPCASTSGAALGGKGACMLKEFQDLIANPIREAGAAADWCKACSATKPLPCLAATASRASPSRMVGVLDLILTLAAASFAVVFSNTLMFGI